MRTLVALLLIAFVAPLEVHAEKADTPPEASPAYEGMDAVERFIEEVLRIVGLADRADDRVKAYSALSLRQLLVASARDTAGSALPAWMEAFYSADRRARGRLTATVKAYAGADMNVQRAARRLGVHPNTIYARARRVEDLTGVNLLTYHGLTELLLAAEANL